MIGKIFFENDYAKVSYHCGSGIQYKAKLEQVEFEKKKGKAIADANNKDGCMLQMCDDDKKKETQGNGQSELVVKYNCNKPIISIEQILKKRLEVEDKMDYFYKLIELAINHKKQKITHFNIKPSNVILYNDRFYLIDFGYLENKPADIVIGINYIQYKDHDDQQKRNLYPYINDQLLTYIKENNNGIREKLNQMSKRDIQNHDRYSLGVLMLELFVPIQNFDIDSCIDSAKNRKTQLERIGDSFGIDGESVVEQIKNIIQDILLKYELPSDKDVNELKQMYQEYQKRKNFKRQPSQNLSFIQIYGYETDAFISELPEIIQQEERNSEQAEITLQEKMNSEYRGYAINLTDNRILKFDPNLLYYLNQKELQDYSGKTRNQEFKELNEKATLILSYEKKIKAKMMQKVDFEKMDKEDQYYILNNILKDNIQFDFDFQNVIKDLNSMNPKDFKFNQINNELTEYPQIKEIEQKQKTEQTGKQFEQMLQNKIPNIMRFLEYQHILENEKKKKNETLNYQFEQTIYENADLFSAKENNQNKIWNSFENTEKYKKLLIGDSVLDPFQDYQGRVIEERKSLILDYQNVTYNLEQDKYSGNKVKVYTYDKSVFKLISFYDGEIKHNKYHGNGLIKDWINNYEYHGDWNQGKKHGQNGKLKIINTEVLQQYEFSELSDVIYSDDYLRYGKASANLSEKKKSLVINFKFYDTFKVYKYGNQNFLKFDYSKLCTILGSKLADQLCSAKNSLCKCKKAWSNKKNNSN